MIRFAFPCITVLASIVLAAFVSSSQAADTINFNRDIRPILSDRCFACHGPDEEANESGLRLDEEESMLEELPSGDGFALVPGEPSSSELLQRILSDDESLLMPPPDSNLEVSKEEIELLQRWIDEGGNYSQHWSFIAPVQVAPPKNSDPRWSDNVIDRFVRDRLKDEQLEPSPPADPYTMIRRVTLDLTGLPPNAEEVAAFVQEESPDAYERLVDRLLARPHFGERMALDWLDAARYADTNGFSIDGGRHMWLWRDWVIDAFNHNKPYNEFLIEQLAGDLLPDATAAQRIASGFQRNNMVTHEGGTIPEENLTNYNVDRVKTLGESILGLTLACCQCHDHKYDPITQKDYFSLYAYFNTLNDKGRDGNGGVNPKPYLQAKTVLRTGEEAELRAKIGKLKEELAHPDSDQVDAWEKAQHHQLDRRGDGLTLLPLQIKKISTPNRGDGFEIEEERLIRITQPSDAAAYDVLSVLPASDVPITGLRFVFHSNEDTPGGGWGYGPKDKLEKAKAADKEAQDASEAEKQDSLKGNFVLTAVSASAGSVPADQVDLFRLIRCSSVTASSWQEDFRPEGCLDMRRIHGWSPALDSEGRNSEGSVHLTWTFDEPIDSRLRPNLTTQLNFGFGKNLIAAEIEIFAITGTDDGSSLRTEVIAALEVLKSQRTEQQTQWIHAEFSARSPHTRRLRIDLANAQERLDVQTQSFSTMVMDVSENPRETFILARGDYSKPTTKVTMDTPSCLPKSGEKQQSRLALARWVTMPEHPLTSRVYVNRIWQMMFGVGIVRTPADFGSQGAWPSHPELLDWLAVEFVDTGWDMKRMIKKIAMSSAYRQSSVTTAELLERDPANQLLARGPRYRLYAESIRDSALAASGLLSPDLGGPSVNPYAPGDLWREISHYGSSPATAQTFVQDHGDKLYRRSLYTFWKRTSPPPNLVAFDAPNREMCVVNRPVTNTPLQALVMLNDVQFVEAARAFAERILQREGDVETRIRWAIVQSLSRPARDLEIKTLAAALDRERSRYQLNTDAAQQLLSVGESPRDTSIPLEEHAAWTQVASTLLNLSEAVTRN